MNERDGQGGQGRRGGSGREAQRGPDRGRDDHSGRNGREGRPGERQRDARRGRGGDGARPAEDSRDRQADRYRTSDPARSAAYEVLRSVEESDSYANLVLPPLMRRRSIYGRDAAFATELTYGTLRMRGLYDPIIEIAADRALADLDAPIVDLLRLGAHQLLNMRVPAHAAVSETVGCARAFLGSGRSQLVNAVLRRISERDPEAWLEELSGRATSTDERLAAKYSHPEWIVRAFRQALATDDEELAELLEANNVPAEVTLVLRPGLTDADGVPYTGAGRLAPTARILHGGDPGALPSVRDGSVGVQDEGSQLVALAFAHAPIDGPDRTWLDLCAGPGGKAALLASWLAARTGVGIGPGHRHARLAAVTAAAAADAGDGAMAGDTDTLVSRSALEETAHPAAGSDQRPRTRRFVANEIFQHRADLVRSSLRAIPDSIAVEVRTGDGRLVGEFEPGAYDRVLVDAPCTGLGALRRRPESRWRRSPADLAELGEIQRDLLLSAITATRVGGLIGYVTCSPHVAETRFVVQDVVKAAARKGLPVEIIDAVAAVQRVSLHPLEDQQGPYVQLWPHRHGTDAMFLALLQRCAPDGAG